MADIVKIGKKSTIIEGTEAQINEIRQKLHDLGFNFENYQYIELKPIDNTPKHSNQALVFKMSPAVQQQPAAQPAQNPQPAQKSQPKPTPKPQPAQKPQPKPEPKPQPQPTQKPQPAPASQSDLPYEIIKIENGFQINIPQSKMDLVLSQFPIVRNVQKKRISKPSPNDPNSNYFFILKPQCVEFNVYPPESNVDEHRTKETALRLLSLIK